MQLTRLHNDQSELPTYHMNHYTVLLTKLTITKQLTNQVTKQFDNLLIKSSSDSPT